MKSEPPAIIETTPATLGYRILELEAHAGWWAEHRELVFSLAAGAPVIASPKEPAGKQYKLARSHTSSF